MRKMKLTKIGVISLVLVVAIAAGLVLFFINKTNGSQETTYQTAKVQKGTLKVDVSASGNLALSQTADLAFDVSGYVICVSRSGGGGR